MDTAEPIERTPVSRRRARCRALQIGSLTVAGIAAAVLAITATAILATRPGPTAAGGQVPSATASTSPATTTPASPPVSAANLAHYRWSTMPDAPITARDQAAIGWTGAEMIVWGGVTEDGKTDLADGAAYNPTTKSWRVLPASPLDARIPQASVWTGTEFIVWGGDGGQTDGAGYNPATDSWRAIPKVPGQTAAGGTADVPTAATAAWTGEVVQLLTWRYQGSAIQSWYYSPSRDTWTQGDPIQPATNAEVGGAALLVRGDEIDAFVGWSYLDSGGMFDKVTAYVRTSGDALWRPVAYRPDLQRVGPVVGAGSEIMVAGGQPFVGFHSAPAWTVPGRRLDPATGASTELPDIPHHADLSGYQIAWTGAALLAYATDGYEQDPDGTTTLPGRAAAWDPDTNAWTVLESAPLAPYGVTSGMWTGTELVSWGLMFPPDRANDPDRQVRAAGLVFGPAG